MSFDLSCITLATAAFLSDLFGTLWTTRTPLPTYYGSSGHRGHPVRSLRITLENADPSLDLPKVAWPPWPSCPTSSEHSGKRGPPIPTCFVSPGHRGHLVRPLRNTLENEDSPSDQLCVAGPPWSSFTTSSVSSGIFQCL